MRVLFLAFFLCILAFSCVPAEAGGNKNSGAVSIDLKDTDQRKVIEFGDRRQRDSLVIYLRNAEPSLRYLSLMAFASSRDSAAIDVIAPLLRDPVEQVRIAAALALGQTGSAKAQSYLLAAYERTDSLSAHQEFNGAVLEAVGRCGTKEQLLNLASIKTFKPSDTLLLEGQCRGIYRFATRGITSPEGTSAMVQYVGNNRIPAPARLMAAHYLARAKDITLDSVQVRSVIDGFWGDSDPNIRMALARAAKHSKSAAVFWFLAKAITTERDYRVKCNLVQSFAKMGMF